jgi:hypothetical protein
MVLHYGRWNLLLKSVTCNRDTYRKMLLEKVIPAIKEKFPPYWKNFEIQIQQDNATPHIKNDDEDFLAVAKSGDGWVIKMVNQPPNSPDTNICDLSFFVSIQALQQEEVSNTMAELVEAVKRAFEEYDPRRLNHAWLTLMTCYNEIIECQGGNDYKIPHMGKQALERAHKLPFQITVTNHAKLYLGEHLNNGIRTPPRPLRGRSTNVPMMPSIDY